MNLKVVVPCLHGKMQSTLSTLLALHTAEVHYRREQEAVGKEPKKTVFVIVLIGSADSPELRDLIDDTVAGSPTEVEIISFQEQPAKYMCQSDLLDYYLDKTSPLLRGGYVWLVESGCVPLHDCISRIWSKLELEDREKLTDIHVFRVLTVSRNKREFRLTPDANWKETYGPQFGNIERMCYVIRPGVLRHSSWSDPNIGEFWFEQGSSFKAHNSLLGWKF